MTTTTPATTELLRTALEESKAAWQAACSLRDRLVKDRADEDLRVLADRVVARASKAHRALESERMRRLTKAGRSAEDVRATDRLCDAMDRADRFGGRR